MHYQGWLFTASVILIIAQTQHSTERFIMSPEQTLHFGVNLQPKQFSVDNLPGQVL